MELLGLLALAVYAGLITKAVKNEDAAPQVFAGHPVPSAVQIPTAYSVNEARHAFLRNSDGPVKCVRLGVAGKNHDEKLVYSFPEAMDFFEN
jgi:hypothetical protein